MNSNINVSRKRTTGSGLKRIERRAEKRLERSLPVSILDCEGKTKNISPKGVYFEVTTKDIKYYSPGKEIMVYIEGNDSKSVGTACPTKSFRRERSVWITVFGVIVRIDDKGYINQDKKLGVALKFSKEPIVFF
jgi:hypothetical protein